MHVCPGNYSASGIPMHGGAFPTNAVRLVGQGVDSARVDPAVVEIEHGAYGDGEIDSVILPTNRMERLHIFRGDARGIVVYLVHETEQSLVFFIELGILQVA